MPSTHPAFDGAKAAVLKDTHPAALPVPAHPDDAAVDALATLMKSKLAKQRAKGYGGWDTDCTRERLSELLRGHVDKGDPVDVANFCAFLSARGEGIATETSTQTPSQLQARVAELEAALGGMYESFGPLAWGSDDNKRDVLTDARKALGVE